MTNFWNCKYFALISLNMWTCRIYMMPLSSTGCDFSLERREDENPLQSRSRYLWCTSLMQQCYRSKNKTLKNLNLVDTNDSPSTCRLESLIPGASRFTLAPYDTSTAATTSTSTVATTSTTTSTSRTGSSTRSVQPAGGEVVSQVQRKVQECFLTGKCWTWYSKKDLMKNLPKIGAVVAFNEYIGAKPSLRDGNLVTKKSMHKTNCF